MKLSLGSSRLYRVKRGQTLGEIAAAFGVPPRLLAAHNRLGQEPEEGQVLFVPEAGDLYTVRGGETKTLLSGSPERYCARNGTDALYPGQTVVLG